MFTLQLDVKRAAVKVANRHLYTLITQWQDSLTEVRKISKFPNQLAKDDSESNILAYRFKRILA